MRIDLDEVSVKGVKRWKEDGKTRQQTRKFWQTVNPFNKNPDGTMKTHAQILEEVKAERAAWLSDKTGD